MAKSLLVINVDIRETRVALIENGIIAELHIERESSRGTLGNIYLGKVSRVLPGMQAAFIDVGLERAAFLHVEDLIRPDDFEAYLAGHRRGHSATDRSARLPVRAQSGDAEPAEEEVEDEASIDLPTAAEVSESSGAEAYSGDESDEGREHLERDRDGEEEAESAEADAADVEDAPEDASAADADGAAESAQQAEGDYDAQAEGDYDAQAEGDYDAQAGGDYEAQAEGDDEGQAEGEGEAGADAETQAEAHADAQGESDESAQGERAAKSEGNAETPSERTAESGGGFDAQAEGAVEAEGDADARAEGESAEAARGEEAQQAGEEAAALGTPEPVPTEEALTQTVAAQRGRSSRGARGGRARVRRSGRTSDRRAAQVADSGEPAASVESTSSGDPNRDAGREPGREAGRGSGNEPNREGGRGGGRDGGRGGRGGRGRGGREGSGREGSGREGSGREGSGREGGGREGGGREGSGGSSDSGDSKLSDRGGRGGGRDGRSSRDSGDRRGGGGGRGRQSGGGRGGRDSRDSRDSRDQRDSSENRGLSTKSRSHEPPRVSKTTPIREVVREGQEVIVQISKEPIGTKGARVTSHISLPGRYVVYLPTVDHVGISKRIGSEKERARLREAVEAMKPPQGGIIVRTLAEGLTKKQLKADVGYLVRLWGEVAKKRESSTRAPTCIYTELDLVLRTARDLFTDDIEKIVIDGRDEYGRLKRFVEMFMPERADAVEFYEGEEPIFDAYGIEDEIQRALARKVPLPSGGYLIIDQAEALTAIDVNTGRFVGKGSKDLEETILATNLEAVEEIAYQLRFRNIGGLIILDLIDMERASNREKVRRRLEDLLAKDKAKTTLNRISDLGLIEMTRKRTRESLGRTVLEPCFYCDGTGQLQSKQTVAYEILRQIRRERGNLPGYSVVVNAHPAVIDFLKNDERVAVQEAERLFTRRIELVPRKEYHLEQFDLQGR